MRPTKSISRRSETSANRSQGVIDMKIKSKHARIALFCLMLTACGLVVIAASAAPLAFGPERRLGQTDKNPSTPFLRYSPNGRLFAIWTQDDDRPLPTTNKEPAAHQHAKMKRAPSPMRMALLASSADGGKSWARPKQVNADVEAIEGEEGGPKVAFSADKKAYVVWSIPDDTGDKTRANIRFAMEDNKGGFTPARTLNEIRNTARFPMVEFTPDNTLLVGWIDRRVDNPIPRSLYLMRISPTGEELTKSYKVGEGLCECCRLGVTFADGGKTVYMVDRQVSEKQIRNHVLRKSTDGGKTFGAPVEIADDGWQVPTCPHSGPTIGQDGRGYLHMTWFTLGRSPSEAGVYYTVSKDGGKTFAQRQLIHANTAAEILHPTMAVAKDGTVYLAWDNLDESNKAQIFVRTLASEGKTWSPVQQISRAKQNANRPVLALSNNELHIGWTETDGEQSSAVLRSAALRK
jgi:hypothetical protein